MTTITEKPSPAWLASDQVERIDLTLIRDNPWQPRQSISEEAITDLAESIAQVGLLQPPAGRRMPDGTVQLAFGHQRVAAIRRLVADGRWPGGVPVQLRPLSDQDMALIGLTENQKRRALNSIEEFRAYKRALDTIPELTITSLAQKLGLDRSTLSNNLRLLKLPDVALEQVAAGRMPLHSARECLCLVNDDHCHAEELAEVVAYLDREGNKDWGITMVRSGIKSVLDKDGRRWQPLDTCDYSYVGRTMPAFDALAFINDFPRQVHKVPVAWAKGAILWTCHGAEWHKRQKAALAAQGKAEKTDADPLARVLAADPLVKAALGDAPVSRETLDNLTPEQQVQLGTRLEDVGDIGEHNKRVGFCRILAPNYQDSPPPYFAGPEECRACTRGAAYGNRWGKPVPVCVNQECFEGKVNAGRQQYAELLGERRKMEDEGDRAVVSSLLQGPGLGDFAAYHVGRNLLMLLDGCNRYSGAPSGEGRWRWGMDWDYWPATLGRIAELLGLPLAEDIPLGRGTFKVDAAIRAFEQAPKSVWREVAALLLAYAERRRLKEGG